MPGLLVVPPMTGGLTSWDPREVTHTILAVLEGSVTVLAVSLTTSNRWSVRYTKPKWFTPRLICSSKPAQAMPMRTLGDYSNMSLLIELTSFNVKLGCAQCRLSVTKSNTIRDTQHVSAQQTKQTANTKGNLGAAHACSPSGSNTGYFHCNAPVAGSVHTSKPSSVLAPRLPLGD